MKKSMRQRKLILIVYLTCATGCATTHSSMTEVKIPKSADIKQEPASNLNEIDRSWKARGLQAQERLAKLSKKKNKNKYELCSEYFETGFAEHANPKTLSDLKKDIDGHRIYILRFFSPVDPELSDHKDALVSSIVTFDYNSSGDLEGTSLQVAKGWFVSFIKNVEGILLADKKCHYFIYPDDPLSSKAREHR